MDIANGYIPQVGDRVRQPDEDDSDAVTVTAVGEQVFLGKYKDSAFEYAFRYGDNRSWVKVEPLPTYPERWINVYSGGGATDHFDAYSDRDRADRCTYSRRIAVIHLASDGTVTLHPVERGS